MNKELKNGLNNLKRNSYVYMDLYNTDFNIDEFCFTNKFIP